MKTASSSGMWFWAILPLLPLLLGLGVEGHASTTSRCATLMTLSPALAQVVVDIIGPEAAGQRLRGVAAFSPLPEKLKIPEVAAAGRVDLERMIAAKPACFFYAPGVLPVEVIERLRKATSKVKSPMRLVSVPMDSLAQISGAYAAVGDLLGEHDSGLRLSHDFEERLKALKGKLAGLRVLAQIDADPMIVVGGAPTFLSEALAHLGVVNLFSQLKEAYPRISMESAVSSAPDRIWILGEAENRGRYESMANSWKKRFPSLKVVKEGGVRVILSRELTLPTRSLLDGLQRVVRDEVR